MKVIITSKNVKTTNYLKDIIEKKMAKLDKYFSDDIPVNVMITGEKNHEKIEATIRVKGTIFRAESKADDAYEAIDKVVAKLSTQMARFKGKLQKKHKGNQEFKFEEWPEPEQAHEFDIARRKKFDLVPMDVEEAVMQMEMLGHNFFVFLSAETDNVCVVYRREGDDYGLLETSY